MSNKTFKEEYYEIKKKYSNVINTDLDADSECRIIEVVKNILDGFIRNHKNVAIYCYGEHTQYLLAEFIYELRNVQYIIDNGITQNNTGYTIIKDGQIEENHIDGVIVSTYQFRDEITNTLKEKHSKVEYVDFYEEFEKKGIKIDGPFYRVNSPFSRYESINKCNLELNENPERNYKLLIENYLAIQDFRMVYETAYKLFEITNDDCWLNLSDDFQELYRSFLRHLNTIHDSVLLLCMDAMRRDSLADLKKTYPILKRRGKVFENFYAYSTSTFESLYPAFLENTDQRTKYYDSNAIDENDCRFVREAIKTGRNVYVIGDGFAYFKGEHIKSDARWTSLTQKLFTFLTWAEDDPTGVFWVQPPYESHVSFISPYCDEQILIKPANVFFEYEKEDDKLDGRFFRQYKTAINYIDDTLCEFIDNLSCRTLFFSDHGDHSFEYLTKTAARDINELAFSAKEENIRIPFVMISPEETGGQCDSEIHSLTEINDIVCAMLNKTIWKSDKRDYIKIGRTAIYNPKLKRIIKEIFCQEQNAMAFEGFVFREGYKLLIFSNGIKKLYDIDTDLEIINEQLVESLFDNIKDEVSVLSAR